MLRQPGGKAVPLHADADDFLSTLFYARYGCRSRSGNESPNCGFTRAGSPLQFRNNCTPKSSSRILIIMSQEKATFGAGCFWGVEAAFAAIPGVTATAVGYEGGSLERPSYKDVCTDQTGHAEVVEMDFDPAQVSFEQLLDAFFALHDPTTLNRQGPDRGTQYRSAIFYHSPEQEAQARTKIDQLTAEGRFDPNPIVTQVEPAQSFWRAEEYHQRYLEKHGQTSCHI